MAGNSFGNIFKLSSFGESHGKALGGVIDGCPAGIELDLEIVNKELNRRRPGQSEIVTQRKEDDSVEFLSGIFEGKTTGTPIGFIIVNKDQKSKDYSHIQNSYRPSHADFACGAPEFVMVVPLAPQVSTPSATCGESHALRACAERRRAMGWQPLPPPPRAHAGLRASHA